MAMINPLVIAVSLISEEIPTINASPKVFDHFRRLPLFFKIVMFHPSFFEKMQDTA